MTDVEEKVLTGELDDKSIVFEVGEAIDPISAFFAVYAGLRMYAEQKIVNMSSDAVSLPAAEAYCMLEELEEKFPKNYSESRDEYDRVYGTRKVT
jgi:hypothetical protein